MYNLWCVKNTVCEKQFTIRLGTQNDTENSKCVQPGRHILTRMYVQADNP